MNGSYYRICWNKILRISHISGALKTNSKEKTKNPEPQSVFNREIGKGNLGKSPLNPNGFEEPVS